MHFRQLRLLHFSQEGIDEEYQIMYVGSLSVEIDPMDQDVRISLSTRLFSCQLPWGQPHNESV